MPLQAPQFLSMVGLGIDGDEPPDPGQPPLVDGVHLRWQFGAFRGFPWHGFYLFRRPHQAGERICLTGRLRGLATSHVGPPANGELGLPQHSFPEGTFSSDRPLVVTDDFPAPFFAEFDLRNRERLVFTFAEPVRFVSCRIGFRGAERDLTCITFGANDPPLASAPRVKNGVSITTRGFDGADEPTSALGITGAGFVVDLSAGARIELPCAADRVVVHLVVFNQAGSVSALDGDGNVVAQSSIPAPQNDIAVIELEGAGIRRLELSLPQNETSLLRLCWHCADDGPVFAAGPNEVALRYFAGIVPVGGDTASGAAGTVVTREFTSDLITAVEFSGANAALVDICYVTVRSALSRGWAPVPELTQPIALPVRDPHYPASGNLATSEAASRGVALDRITYGNPAEWDGARFGELHAAVHRLVDQGPAGPLMAAIGDDDVPGVPGEPGPAENPSLRRLSPLNFLMLGALDPQVAQMLGLYHADQTALPGVRYDYMVVADHANVANGNASDMLGFLFNPGANFFLVDVYIAFDLMRDAAPPLDEPANVRVYALPGATRESAGGTLSGADNNAGLRWDIATLIEGELAPGAPALYRIARASLGASEPFAPPPLAAFETIHRFPHAVADANVAPGETENPRSPEWPPVPLGYIDQALAEGWYAYRLNAIDIFGRWSAPSAPAAWWQWSPAPPHPPWYYDSGAGDAEVNPFAVRLLDKRAPPPPTQVEAFALDPADRYLDRDARFVAWFATLSPPERDSLIGLRVRWLWTFAQMRQAPDTAEFRVYLRDGLANTFKGRVSGVTAPDATTSRVTTTIANGEGADAFVGAVLRTGSRSFSVTGSEAGSPLVLDVANLRPGQDERPAEGLRCTVTLPGGTRATHPLAVDLGRPTAFDERIRVVGIDDHVAEGIVPGRTAAGATLAGGGATSAGSVATLPAGHDIGGVAPLDSHIFLADDTARPSRIYRVLDVDPATRQLTLDGTPNLSGGQSDFEVGILVRRYELFLPAPNDTHRSGLSLPVSRAEPTAYAQVGVSAADDKTHTADAPKWAGDPLGGRTGNEGAAGGPATVVRVNRTPPPAPRVPPDSEAVFASTPDYRRQSFYTVRWVREADVGTHVFRAVDDAVFARDWSIRETRAALAFAAHSDVFPGGWGAGRANAAAAELNAIAAPADYAGLSADAVDVLGRLPGNEGFASAGGLAERDLLIRRTRTALAGTDDVFFPEDWTDPLVRSAAADLLNAIAARADYADLSNNALRVLAGLPGNEAAFQQVTDVPLANQGPSTENRAGPDNPPDFAVDPALRAYIARLDGRARNRTFYRTAFVDKAQNTGPLGLSSPPVHIRDVAPPRRPVFLRALAGDPDAGAEQSRKVTLAWASNREPDLAAYRLFRTADAGDARATRLMDFVTEITVGPGAPAARPAEVVFVDTDVPGLVTFTYRLEAIDTAGNRSQPSTPVAARAFDTALPEVPDFDLAWIEQAGITRAQLEWTSEHEVLVQRREAGGPWIDLAQWRAPGTVVVRDPFSEPSQTLGYRLQVRKYTGARARGEPQELLPLSP